MTGSLVVRKENFSVHPWRVFEPRGGLVATFPLKRDAVAWVKTVEHLPWTMPLAEWDTEQISALRLKLAETPGAKLHKLAVERSITQP